jgi:tetratricopeptide (TPR) repeat protein
LQKNLIRKGREINGFSGNKSSVNLYSSIHTLERRLLGLSHNDRSNFQTFDDPGPPVDATGTAVLDQVIKQESVEELEKQIIDFDNQINAAVESPPNFLSNLHKKRGIVLGKLHKFSRAMDALDMAIKLDPSNFDALWFRHQLYLRYNDAEAALVDLDRITEIQKSHIGAFQSKARVFQALGMYRAAIFNYSFVIRYRPEHPDAYYNRACLFEIEDEQMLANEDFRAVRLLDPNNDQAVHNLAMYSFQKQLWSDCIQETTKLIMFNPDNADAYMYRGRSYAALSLFSEALEVTILNCRI